ncbi:MAG: hypothetical protein JSV04_02600 [Candidatus Heimdallarchaeota archaeon]|nr:MAG: hypothetical protein JSV04_02600 [Candidatus Heimdallarchaeota archaeon]
MKLLRKKLFFMLVFSFVIMSFLFILTETSADIYATSDQIDILNVTFEGSIVSITLESEVEALDNFYLLILFDGNGDPSTWEAAMLFSHNLDEATIYWMLSDPFITGHNWIQGYHGTHYQFTGALIQLTFIEYTALGYPETHIVPLALISTSDFSVILFEFALLLPEPSTTAIPPTSTTTSTTTTPTEPPTTTKPTVPPSITTTVPTKTTDSSTSSKTTQSSTTSTSSPGPATLFTPGFEFFIIFVGLTLTVLKIVGISKQRK